MSSEDIPRGICLKVSLFVYSCAERARSNKCSADELRRNHAKWSPVCQHVAECRDAFQTGNCHVPDKASLASGCLVLGVDWSSGAVCWIAPSSYLGL